MTSKTRNRGEAQPDLGFEQAAEGVERELPLKARLVPQLRCATHDAQHGLNVYGLHNRHVTCRLHMRASVEPVDQPETRPQNNLPR